MSCAVPDTSAKPLGAAGGDAMGVALFVLVAVMLERTQG